MIDFQDALQGPRQYDLVALLRDSYVELDRPSWRRCSTRYARALRGGRRTRRSTAGAFRRFFDLLTVQRKLKDAGRFEFIDRVKKNPSFLPHIPASLRYVRWMRCSAGRSCKRSAGDPAFRHVPELR